VLAIYLRLTKYSKSHVAISPFTAGTFMPRALWKGAISFGLIYVPVELHTASKDNTLPLHMLDSRDFAAVGYQRVNKKTGKEVDWAHIVKGYEYKKGEFVALANADFKHANVKASETIEIDTFCDVDSGDVLREALLPGTYERR